MRFERSSVSMVDENSRNFPTVQEKTVGNFRLEGSAEKSDKSAMPSVDQIRFRIQRAMDSAGDGAVTVAIELGLERNYLRDFLEGKKQSLKAEIVMALSEKYDIPFKGLLVKKEKLARRRVC